jgi:putative DNA primase/helicase
VTCGQIDPGRPEAQVAKRLAAVGADRVRELRMTDLGNCHRLIREHGHDLRHIAGLGWYVWDGRRWRRDDSGEVIRRAKQTIIGLFEEAVVSLDGEMAEWARKSAAEPRLRAAVSLAESELPVIASVDELDADPWLLNCANGTVDLLTGELREHRREDLITKISATAYDADATCPTWERFLEQVTEGRSSLIDFLARAAGYALTGLSREHVLLFLYGLGANGKTTFLRTLLRLTGEYGIQAEPDLLLVRRNEAHPTGVADLFGIRFAVCVEIDEGRRLAESLVKQLTGGDRIRARRMRCDFFEFEPTHTVWLAANHKPGVRGTDDAIWRRVRLIPFDVTIPVEQRDPELPDKLAAELPGILAWAVRGCLAWQKHGLELPEEVRAATESYRAEQDVLGAFFADRCVLEPGVRVRPAALHAEYVAWCEQTREHPMTQTAFGLRLRERGFEQQRTGAARWWVGIGLLDDRSAENPS